MTYKTYIIEFPIGDWSGDGHDHCQYFNLESNKSVEELREIHFKSKEILGFKIGDICCYYFNNKFPQFLYDCMTKRGVDWRHFLSYEPDDVTNPESYYMGEEDILKVWIWCLTTIDSTLTLKIIPKQKHVSINFFGFDNKDRHLDTPGYGVYNG